jgi:hypothetical protein
MYCARCLVSGEACKDQLLIFTSRTSHPPPPQVNTAMALADAAPDRATYVSSAVRRNTPPSVPLDCVGIRHTPAPSPAGLFGSSTREITAFEVPRELSAVDRLRFVDFACAPPPLLPLSFFFLILLKIAQGRS